jgi:hypothetical protein
LKVSRTYIHLYNAKVIVILFPKGLYDLSGIPEANRKGENSPKARVDKLMVEMDLDKDKVLNFNEFVDGVTKNEAIKEFLLDPLFHQD